MVRLRYILSVVAFFACSVAVGQQVEQLAFEERDHDFGVIQEEDGPVMYEFKFTNNGTEPVSITNVKASCGCTTPAWTREPVAPGASGFVQAKYNPRNRPGKFNKSLTISLSQGPQQRVYIRGEVTPRKRTPEEMYPAEFGALRMKYKSLNMGKVYVNRPVESRKFELYNQSDSLVIINPGVAKPAHIVVEFDTLVVPPKGTVEMSISYDGAARGDFGFMNDSFQFTTNEAADSAKAITVYATLLEYFPRPSAGELATAPKLQISDTEINLDKVAMDSQTVRAITITNSGKSTLLLRKFEPNCTCLTVRNQPKELAPGQSTDIELVFNAVGRRGNQQKSVTIYSNDPSASTQRVVVKAVVEE